MSQHATVHTLWGRLDCILKRENMLLWWAVRATLICCTCTEALNVFINCSSEGSCRLLWDEERSVNGKKHAFGILCMSDYVSGWVGCQHCQLLIYVPHQVVLEVATSVPTVWCYYKLPMCDFTYCKYTFCDVLSYEKTQVERLLNLIYMLSVLQKQSEAQPPESQ